MKKRSFSCRSKLSVDIDKTVDCTLPHHRMWLYQWWRLSCTRESAEDLPLKVLEMEINAKYERGQRIFVAYQKGNLLFLT